MSKSELFKKVEKALQTIRPFLLEDGGDVQIKEITQDNEVIIELQGNCADCPMSSMTLKAGVAETILTAIPEIKNVISSDKT